MAHRSLRTASWVFALAVLGPASTGAAPLTLSSLDIISGPVTGPAVLATQKPAQWVSGDWWAPSTDQRFNDPYIAGTGSLPGDYVYRITFDLTGFDLSSVVIAGGWTTDNSGALVLNGATIDTVGPTAYGAAKAFTLVSGFVAGVNTLDFHVNNEGAPGATWAGPSQENPTGVHLSLREASADPLPMPEPATSLLLGLGLLAVRLARRKRA